MKEFSKFTQMRIDNSRLLSSNKGWLLWALNADLISDAEVGYDSLDLLDPLLLKITNEEGNYERMMDCHQELEYEKIKEEFVWRVPAMLEEYDWMIESKDDCGENIESLRLHSDDSYNVNIRAEKTGASHQAAKFNLRQYKGEFKIYSGLGMDGKNNLCVPEVLKSLVKERLNLDAPLDIRAVYVALGGQETYVITRGGNKKEDNILAELIVKKRELENA